MPMVSMGRPFMANSTAVMFCQCQTKLHAEAQNVTGWIIAQNMGLRRDLNEVPV